jgi:hypothetical protein
MKRWLRMSLATTTCRSLSAHSVSEGFDAQFEKDAKKRACSSVPLTLTATSRLTSKNIGPSLLIRPPKDDFDMQRQENDYNMEAFRQGSHRAQQTTLCGRVELEHRRFRRHGLSE